MRENRSLGFRTRSYTNWPVQSGKIARSSKFQIQEEEELYYLCSGSKGADQQLTYSWSAFCFRIGKNPGFPRRGS